ncbi:alpha/beta hydrolase [Mycolicibacterium sp. P1-5]|uniref:alpha/beta hydrolase n=1 Tax=Mycolicibacterium sp. P1-5 TaxID=2024617 RepID=UPI0011ED8BE0|nr:alpha/beta hydrolase [Mycolicibacterium sp. P1-5]KAA0111224.1 alpha/beta hydrolase [Mycolicibacterium sp. P1-5]
MNSSRARLKAELRRPHPVARAIAELANAANGFRPLGRQGYKTLAVFSFGWPTSEQPMLYLGGSVVDAVRRGLRGDFRGGRGIAALALTALSWVFLLAIQRRNVTTPGPVLHDALVEGLGEDFTEVLKTLPSTPSPSGRPTAFFPVASLAPAWRTTWSRRRFVDKTSTISYGPHGRANVADVWRRRDLPRDGKAPVLLEVPGGAWAIGWRRPQGYPLMSHLADRGWICVAMNYRVSPAHSWPDHIVDVKRALAWIKDNIADYGGDPDFVAITGGSAGGHLAALAALTADDPEYQPGFPDADTSVQAAVPVYGRYDWYTVHGNGRREFIGYLERLVVKRQFTRFREIYTAASPIRRLRADAPPFFILHGEYDSVIPVDEAREFVGEFRKVAKGPVLYAELPGAQHGFDIMSSPRAHQSAEAVGQFLSWVYATWMKKGEHA